MTRIVLQNTDSWFDDDVDEAVRERTSKDGHGELVPVRVSHLFSILYILIFRIEEYVDNVMLHELSVCFVQYLIFLYILLIRMLKFSSE